MITNTGIWTDDESKYHINSKQLSEHLQHILNTEEIIFDFGCGTGFYLHALKDIGFKKLIGIDGSYLTKTVHPNIFIYDLSKKLNLWNKKGQVISFEVGEHIPEEYEQIFIDNLTNHCDSRLILSWAIPGQGGIGHVNCKSNEYICNEITRRGFSLNIPLTFEIRQGDYSNTPWFYNTLQVFDKNKD